MPSHLVSRSPSYRLQPPARTMIKVIKMNEPQKVSFEFLVRFRCEQNEPTMAVYYNCKAEIETNTGLIMNFPLFR